MRTYFLTLLGWLAVDTKMRSQALRPLRLTILLMITAFIQTHPQLFLHVVSTLISLNHFSGCIPNEFESILWISQSNRCIFKIDVSPTIIDS
jgi:hypothetical protein